MNMHTKILGSLTALVVLLATPTATAGNVSPGKFAARAGDMAKAAKAAYANGGEGSISLSQTGESQTGTTSHSRVANWSSSGSSTEHSTVQAYKAVTGDTSVSIIIAFKGTQASVSTPVVATGDLLRDLQGAVIRVAPLNPWLGGQSASGNIGQGFNRRVINYMEGPGMALKTRLDELKDEVLSNPDKKVEIHVTGHSLGAISSQIFSFYLSQYMRESGFPSDKDQFKINNFAFNTPRGVGAGFADTFKSEIEDYPFLTAYTFTITGDPVSDWTLSWLRGALIDAAPAGYCAHARFPTVDPSKNPIKKLNNHWLDDDAIFKFGGVSNYQAIDSNLPQCMADGYFSFI